MKNKKTILLVIGSVYVLLFYYIVHVRYVSENYYWISSIDAYSAGFSHMFMHPLQIFPFPHGVFKTLIIITVVIVLILFFVYEESKIKKHDNGDTVAGDAKWMSQKELDNYNCLYTEPFGEKEATGNKNIIFSQDIALAMDTTKTSRNLNSLIIGGSGIGKSFRLVGPNILQHNCSFVVTDPSGGLYRQYGCYLEYYGYRVKCFNLSHMNLSNHYNPFRYIHSDKDIEVLVTMIMTNTKDPTLSGGEQFWDDAIKALLNALIAYLYHYGSPSEQNFANIQRLIHAANVDENNSSMQSPLDKLFEGVDKDSFTMSQYQTFRLGAGKTMKSILISAATRLQAFDLADVIDLTSTDDINLDAIADEKTALFIIIPTGESTFNYLAGLMYSQLFSCIYRYCENTAPYSQVILDSENEVVKTFRVNNKMDVEEKRKEAEAFLESVRDGKIVKNQMADIQSGDKKLKLWEVRTKDDDLVTFRGSEELAREAFEKIKAGKVVQNYVRGNNGERCPIHVRLLMDEFANTSKLPNFTQIVSTIRKYEGSTTIILQSLKQIQNLYEKEWDVISANCDTFMYMGGGLDAETTEWLTKLLGKKTVLAMNQSFSKQGGSSSINHSGLDLFSMSQLRTMKNQECVVIPRNENAYKGKMYDTPNHPGWELLKSLPPYSYDPVRTNYFNIAFHDENPFALNAISENPHESIPNEAPDDEAVRKDRNELSQKKADAAKENKDLNGETLISESIPISSNDEEKIKEILDINSEEEAKKSIESMLEFNFDEGSFDFSSAPMD